MAVDVSSAVTVVSTVAVTVMGAEVAVTVVGAGVAVMVTGVGVAVTVMGTRVVVTVRVVPGAVTEIVTVAVLAGVVEVGVAVADEIEEEQAAPQAPLTEVNVTWLQSVPPGCVYLYALNKPKRGKEKVREGAYDVVDACISSSTLVEYAAAVV